MNLKYLLFFLLLAAGAVKAEKPNIIFIMADDQGYGDASCYNPDSKIPTPGIDQIAREGIRFTDAHSASAVCTPTRYGLLTGRYPWRSKLQKGVMVTGQGNLISPDILTVPKFLKGQGYKTAIVGKWHLGFNYEMPKGKQMESIKSEYPWDTYRVNAAPVGSKVIEGPTTLGFDHYRGFHHAREMHSWIEQDTVTRHIKLEEVIGQLAYESVTWIKERVKKKDGPFFLYLPLGSPHTPITPSKKWLGKSGINAYADFVMETDDCVVQVLKTLEETGIKENTIVFFTTDNGCSPKANFKELISKGHDPSYSLRGHKADGWEGGHRVPYVVTWPAKIKAGSVSKDMVLNLDFAPTFLDMAGAEIPSDLQGRSMRPLLEGKQIDDWRTSMFYHYYEYPHGWHSVKRHYGVRTDRYKLIHYYNDIDEWELYDLMEDPNEMNNIYGKEGYQTLGNDLKNELQKLMVDLKVDDLE